jgi:hypothetical protein
MTDLEEAMEGLDAPTGMELRVETVLNKIEASLDQIPEKSLLSIDAVSASRVAYISALVTILKFLRRPTRVLAPQEDPEAPPAYIDNNDLAKEQARISLGYIKHAETKLLAALQIGRSVKDGALQDEVADLRGQISKLADYRAKKNGKTRTSKTAN